MKALLNLFTTQSTMAKKRSNSTGTFATVLLMLLSWTLLLWINFFGQLSLAMHMIAIPTLLLITGGLAAWRIEQADDNGMPI